jgi:heat shock protein HslJ
MDLSGTSWIVISIDDGSGRLAPLIEGTTLTFAFDGEQVNGSAGCNSYFGPASLGGDVTLGPLASTMMFCSEPVGIMEQERRFLDLLEGVDSFHAVDERLELMQEGETTIVLVPLSVGLEGAWSLLFYNNGSALVSPIQDTETTARFGGGTLSGQAGCNRYTAAYSTEGASLQIGTPAGTRMICPEPEGLMTQESKYLELLPATASYLIRNGRLLELYDGQGLRLLQFARV